jgi:hypothetical protein
VQQQRKPSQPKVKPAQQILQNTSKPSGRPERILGDKPVFCEPLLDYDAISGWGRIIAGIYDDRKGQETAVAQVRGYLSHREQGAHEAAQGHSEQREQANDLTRKQELWSWAGDPARLPAEVGRDLPLKGCEYRAHACYVGRPHGELSSSSIPNATDRPSVIYAMQSAESGEILFKRVNAGPTPDELEAGPEIAFGDINLVLRYRGFSEEQVKAIITYNLAAVPGIDDAFTMWKKA